MNFNFIEIFILVAVLYLLTIVIKLDGRLRAMKYTLDQLSEKASITPHGPVDDELRALIRNRQEVNAIKTAREAMGLSLAEGKKYIETLKAEDADHQ